MKVRSSSSLSPDAQRESDEKIITRWFGEGIAGILHSALIWLENRDNVEEIRLRINQPLQVITGKNEFFLTPGGQSGLKEKAYLVTKEDLMETIERMTQSSLYAAEEQLRQGFLTLPGGHRVGITGETVTEHNQIRSLRHISSLNIRLACEPSADGTDILRQIIDYQGSIVNSLLISPPRAGKTTLLRQLIRHISNGVPKIKLPGQPVGVVDERGELAGMWQGIPAFDLGCRTDILDRCPKSKGLTMLIRSMSPAVVAVDELGSPEDAAALKDAVRCGVRILATAHAGSLEELFQRAYIQELMGDRVFQKVVILSRNKGPGTLEGIHDLGSLNIARYAAGHIPRIKV